MPLRLWVSGRNGTGTSLQTYSPSSRPESGCETGIGMENAWSVWSSCMEMEKDYGDGSVCGGRNPQEYGCRSESEHGSGEEENGVCGGSVNGPSSADESGSGSVSGNGNVSVRKSHCQRMSSVTCGRSGSHGYWSTSYRCCCCCWSERSCAQMELPDQR